MTLVEEYDWMMNYLVKLPSEMDHFRLDRREDILEIEYIPVSKVSCMWRRYLVVTLPSLTSGSKDRSFRSRQYIVLYIQKYSIHYYLSMQTVSSYNDT